MKSPLRPGHVERARLMLLRGWSWKKIAAYLNLHPDTIRSAIDPVHKAKVDRWRKESEARRLQGRMKLAKAALPKQPRQWGIDDDQLTPQSVGAGASLNIPADVLFDRDRRAELAPRSVTAALMGDPPPGMSALDRKRGA